MADVLLPSLAEGVEKASVSYWFKSVGDVVGQGEDLVELVTDKATFNMPSPVAGTIKQILIAEGNEVRVGEKLAVIE